MTGSLDVLWTLAAATGGAAGGAAGVVFEGGAQEADDPGAMIGLIALLAAGIGAQWLAWRLKLPAILLLLLADFVAGPIGG